MNTEPATASFLPRILLVSALPMMVRGAEWLQPLYYGALVAAGLVRLLRCQRISGYLLLVLTASAAGILLNNPPSVFHPWQRLALFSLLLAAAGPLFISKTNDAQSRSLFELLTAAAMFIAALSPIAGWLGFGHSGGGGLSAGATFCGLAPHSMVLGALAGIGTLRALHLAACSRSRLIPTILLGACGLSLLLASSRAAVVATAVALLYLLRQHSRHSRLWVLMLIAGGVLISFGAPLTDGLQHKTQEGLAAGGIFSSREELWRDRWQEFIGSPLLGVGFASQQIVTFAHSLRSGIIEPGSSYLGSLAMVGIIGSFPLFGLLGRAATYHTSSNPLPHAVLLFFMVHMLFEGYILSGGSVLCFLLWCTIAATMTSQCYGSYTHL